MKDKGSEKDLPQRPRDDDKEDRLSYQYQEGIRMCPQMLSEQYETTRCERGFTFIELLIAIVIIGLLAGIALPRFKVYRERANIARTAQELKGFAGAFTAYTVDNEDYPPDSHLTLPPGMTQFISASLWTTETPLGGTYNWEGPDAYPYAGISLLQPTAPLATLASLDRMLDDGNLIAGKFRIGTNGRVTYIIEDGI
jgi:prepilin-type N-terminal cleavage/methylation domain-containing protein